MLIDVKTKIQNIGNASRRELKKNENSNRSGSGTEDIYVPTLWYDNLLLITKDQDIPLASIETQSQNSQTLIKNTETHNYTISDEDDFNQSVIDEATMNVFKQPYEKKMKKKQTFNTDIDEFVKVCTKTLSNPDIPDEFDSTSMSFAAKLRKMSAHQQIFAESLIHKVCTLGLLNKLNENDCVTDNTNNRMLANSLRNDYHPLVQTQVISAGPSSYYTLSMCGKTIINEFNIHYHLLTNPPSHLHHLYHLHIRLP
ncbi:hypothetical protein FQR65_LT17007 [Abscondita terminalis]|nr:hypothetical protein FQR65_LT17007 [Abscondita terminalis]